MDHDIKYHPDYNGHTGFWKYPLQVAYTIKNIVYICLSLVVLSFIFVATLFKKS